MKVGALDAAGVVIVAVAAVVAVDVDGISALIAHRSGCSRCNCDIAAGLVHYRHHF